MLTKSDFIEALQSNYRTPVCRISFLDSSENVLEVITNTDTDSDILSCDITLNLQSNNRRNANLILKNDTLLYLPRYRGRVWLNSKIKIETGLLINGEYWFENRGIFVISEARSISDFANKYVELTLTDKWQTVSGEISGTLSTDYVIPVGSDIETAIRTLFITEIGEVKNPIISGVTGVTPYTITKTAGSSYGDILVELANMLSFVVYYDRFGYPRFESPTNQITEMSVWDFNTSTINYMGSTHYFKFNELKNSCTVIGDNINGDTFISTVSDTYVFSTTRVSLIGQRTFVINDNLIYNQSLADQRATYELQKKVILQEEVNLNCLNNELINEGNIITIRDANNGLNSDRYYVQSINFSAFDRSEMSITAWKTRAIV